MSRKRSLHDTDSLRKAATRTSPSRKKCRLSNEDDGHIGSLETHKLVIYIRPPHKNDPCLPNMAFTPTLRITVDSVAFTMDSQPWSALVAPQIERKLAQSVEHTKFNAATNEAYLYLKLPAVDEWDGEESLIIASDADFVVNVPFLHKAPASARFPRHYYVNAWWRMKMPVRSVPAAVVAAPADQQEGDVGHMHENNGNDVIVLDASVLVAAAVDGHSDEETEESKVDSNPINDNNKNSNKNHDNEAIVLDACEVKDSKHEHELTRTAVLDLVNNEGTDYHSTVSGVECDICLVAISRSAHVYHCTKPKNGGSICYYDVCTSCHRSMRYEEEDSEYLIPPDPDVAKC